MSSWIVTREHITALVDLATVPDDDFTYYHDGRVKGFRHHVTQKGEYWDVLGQMLIDENVRGVGERYADTELTDLPGNIDAHHVIPYKHQFTISDPRTMPTPIEGIKVAQCYRYQACDSGDVWDKSEAASFIQALIEHLIPKLPGYDAAPWGWDESNAHASRQISVMDMLRESS